MEKILELWENEELEVVLEGDWVSEGKYQFSDDVVKHEGKYYQISNYRSGSYHSDYEYGDPTCIEVEPMEFTTIRYVPVKTA